MIVNNIDLIGMAVLPDETDPPLCIDADAVLAPAISLQGLQPVARREAQKGQLGGRVQCNSLRRAVRWISAGRRRNGCPPNSTLTSGRAKVLMATSIVLKD